MQKGNKHIKSSFFKQMFFLLTTLLWFSAYSQELPQKPNPPKLVNDLTNTLSIDEVNLLENKLVKFSDSTSTQIAILMVNDLQGYDKADFAYRVAESWGIGQKGSNNGLLILVKPTGKKGERGAYIAVGYGLEPVITDALSKRIVENEMIPNFRENKFYVGLDKATDVLMKLAIGEFPAGYSKNGNAVAKPFAAIVPIIIIILVFILIRISNRKSFSGGKNPSFWTTLFLLSTMNNSRNSGSWGNFSGGSGGFGGGSSFGGFGGGSFGGGGAGGSW